MKYYSIGVGLTVALATAGCGNLDHRAFLSHQPSPGISTTTAAAQMVVTFEDGSKCFSPAPDAASDTGSDVSIALPLTVTTASAGEAQFNDQIPLGGRNPNVLITRQILFESCLAEQRFKLSKDERLLHWQRTMSLIAEINQRSLEGLSVTNDNIAGKAPTLNYQPFTQDTSGGAGGQSAGKEIPVTGGPYYEKTN